MPIYLYTIDLHLAAPVLSQLSGARSHGLDTAALRAEDKRPALPGSLVRGNLRQSWEYFAARFADTGCPDLHNINAWLGAPSAEGGKNEPQRARLVFDYAWIAQTPGEKDTVRHRIQIDQHTGTVARGALQVIEQPFAPSQDTVCFRGQARARLADENEAKQVATWLRKGLEFVPALGALKGTGFGRVDKVEVRWDAIPSKNGVPATLPGPRFGLSLTLDRPFCFAKHHLPDDNRFESEEFIPGAALRGALARRLDAAPNLARHFDKLHIRHALPAQDNQRPAAISCSLVSAPAQKNSTEKQLYDLVFEKAPGLIHGCAPAFQPDWKEEEWGKVRKECGWPEISRRIEVHTAIDSTTGAADEGQLFALDCVIPGELKWLTEVTLEAVPEQDLSAVLKELRDLLAEGLADLGKTGAYAEITTIPTGQVSEHLAGLGASIALVLQTPARLLPDPYSILSTNDGGELKKCYAEIWRKLSDNALELSHFYARQRLAGGEYLRQRFWVGKPYNPEILTEAGSVFVFAAKDADKAKSTLQEWLRLGLPQADGRENWADNPFIRANGYGEVKIHSAKNKLEGWREI